MSENKKNTSLPCEVVSDILPLYIDNLTSPVTTTLVENHLKSCENCNKKYLSMTNPIVEKDSKVRDKKEIDFLKRTKKHNQRIILLVSAFVILIAILGVMAKYFIIGNDVNAEYLNYTLDVTEKECHISGQSTASSGIKQVQVNESDGIVKITVKAVGKSLFYNPSFDETFQSSQDIRQVWIGGQIVWADGVRISPLTAALYENYNPYIGNMPQNGKLVSTLNMVGYTGNFTNELQTSTEPYGWIMFFETDFPASQKEELEEHLHAYAYILLAEIENLDELTYEYTLNGVSQTLTVTEADASEYAGQNIKDIGKNVAKLELLIRQTGM